MSDQENFDEQIQQMLQPIMDLFTGTDGGIAYVKLRHSLLPHVWSEVSRPNMTSIEFLEAWDKVSETCKILLERQNHDK